ncbi:hypothetical protein FQN49_002669 [Arthroderma sp. PD_2]|nr:hypothetical protein FQN49_002669 [Arthroderma sp. PD_2]
MPSRGHETTETGPTFSAVRPSITITTSHAVPETARQTTPGYSSLSPSPVSPTETEFPSLFSPVVSRSSQRTAASSTSSTDVLLVRGAEDQFESEQDTEDTRAAETTSATTIITSSRLSYNPLRSSDRFLPTRRLHAPASLSFRLSRDPYSLSPTERIRRQRDIGVNVFAYPSHKPAINSRRFEIGDPRLSPHHLPRHINHGLLSEHPSNPVELAPTRRIRTQAMWTFQGGVVPPPGPQNAVSDGHGGLLGSGTVAPLYIANFLARETPAQKELAYESRLAFALDVDQAARVLDLSAPQSFQVKSQSPINSPVKWNTIGWGASDSKPPGSPKKAPKKSPRPVPSTPFRVLDAPLLRDDFYCSTLAYCYTARVLAVGLGHKVYIWSEGTLVRHPPFKDYPVSNHVTSLSFSSQLGGHSILAVGRHGGQVTLWSTFDAEPRFEIRIPHAVSSVCFKGRTTRRTSSRFGPSSVDVEELAIGDERGQIWYYFVEWTSAKWRQRYRWNGAMVLLAKIAAHTQQICGMAWSPDGRYLATGGNDNICFLFDTVELIRRTQHHRISPPEKASYPEAGTGCALSNKLYLLQSYFQCGNNQGTPSTSDVATLDAGSPRSSRGAVESSPPKKAITIPINSHKYKFVHAAAVKAIAFSPWEPTVLATGGGTNDRCIRFYHATSGACLAIINVHAQVTSLIWSKTRREIAATFGYASPEHPYRIAVFEWPSCQQVVAIPWSTATGHERYGSGAPGDCGRALWAISYPGGPNEMVHQLADPTFTRRRPGHGPNRSEAGSEDSQLALSNKEGGTWWSRTAEEGCIIVASSDESVKFHEVWSGTPKSIAGTSGLLGGSAILESLEGIEKETEVIR